MRAAPATILAAAAHPDPYPFYAELLAGGPLLYDDALRLWVVAGAGAVGALLASPHALVRPPAEPVPAALLGTPVEAIYRRLVRMRDDPARGPLKAALAASLGALSPSLAAGSLDEAKPLRSAALARQLDEGIEREQGGWLSEFTLRLPAAAVASLLGAPDADIPLLTAWLRDFVACLGPGADADALARGSGAATALRDYMGELLAQQRAEQERDTVLRHLAGATAAGQADADAIVANGVGLLMQSYEATAGLIGNTLVALAARRSLAARIIDDAGLLHGVLREVLRFDPPIQNTRRYLRQDIQIAGRTLRGGDAVLVVLAAANRDPAANPDPARFDPFRAAPQCFTFGHGGHACPGERLALTIAAAAIHYLLSAGLDLGSIGPVSYRPLVNARVPRFADAGGTRA